MEFLVDPFVDSEKYFATVLQQYQFFNVYSRFDYNKGRRETWKETVQRAVEYLKWLSQNKLDDKDYKDIYEAILKMDVMPSMRLLAMAGDAAKRFPQSIFNCSYTVIDSFASIVEILNISMNGIGVGFSVESRYTDKLPVVKDRTGKTSVFIIPDSTEGWCKSLEIGIDAWFNGEDIVFDYSQIREAGSPLKIKGGRASGYKPLKELLDFTRDIILGCQGNKLTSLNCYDIVCKIGDCVVSGGVRRTAFLCLFDYDDTLMLSAKNYSELKDNPHRYNSNNSRVIERKLTQKEMLQLVMEMDKDGNGEPGIFSRYAANKTIPERRKKDKFGLNPCQPEFATVLTKDGIKTFADIDVGSEIWSGTEWTTVVNKQETGIKPVYVYTTEDEHFVGTNNHKVVSLDNEKIEIDTVYKNELYVMVQGQNRNRPLMTKLQRKIFIGNHPVYDITVDCKSHTYWTGGMIVSNCGEIFLRPKQFCNLSSVICRESDDLLSLLRKVKIATIIGTIQAMADNYNCLSDDWQQNQKDERLLGVDLNGQMDCAIVRDTDTQKLLRNMAVKTNALHASCLGIAPATAITTVKPSGNSGVLLNVSSGIHPRWSQYYIRNVRVSKTSPLYKVLQASGVKLSPENGQTLDNASTFVVSFPMKSPEGAIVRKDVTALQQLHYWESVKLNWTEHNPSASIYYTDNEILDIANWLYRNQDIIGGLTFFPKFEASYAQAPYIEISKAEYESLLAKFPKIDFSLLPQYEDEDLTEASLEVACSSGTCDFKL